MRPGASRTLARLSVAHGSLAERDMRRRDCFAKANHNLDIKPFLGEVKENYQAAGLEDFELFWDNKPVNQLYKAGLLVL